MDNLQEVRKLYSRLKALYSNTEGRIVPELLGRDYDRIVKRLSEIVDDDLSVIKLNDK